MAEKSDTPQAAPPTLAGGASLGQPSPSAGGRRWVTGVVWLLLVAAMAAAYGHTFTEMWGRWFPSWHRAGISLYDKIVKGESYYTHGPLVPLVSLLITVLLLRHTRVPVRPKPILGGAVLALSLLLHLCACYARVSFISGFSFIGVLAGLVLLLWGAQALRRLWFPLALLLFMVPLPEVTIANVNFRLKMLSADWGVRLANEIGVVAVRNGNQVFLPGDKSMVIANVCNGLRTLISLLAFGALYAYVCRLRGLWRLGLFALTIPVAVVSNSLRIVSLILVADLSNVETATGWYHDTSGVLIFVLAFLLMFSLERLILWSRARLGRPAKIVPLFHGSLRGAGDEGQWPLLVRAGRSRRGWVVCVVLALVAGAAGWMDLPSARVRGGDQARKALPADLDVDGQAWHGYDEPLDEVTLTILETRDYLNREYTGGAGAPSVGFTVIFSEDNRKGTHPPDLCLEGSGTDIVYKRDIVVHGVAGRGDLPCRELITQTGPRRHYFLYVYKCGGNYTTSFWRQQGMIFVNGLLNRNASGALIRVSTPVVEAAGGDGRPSGDPSGLEEARQRSVRFMSAATPFLDRNLP